MKEFLDSKAGRTLIIALIATGTTIFAVPWDGAETVLRAGGGAFFGALAPLVFYLMKNEGEAAQEEMQVQPWWPGLSGTIPPGNVIHSGASNAVTIENLTDKAINVTDFDNDYHFTDDGRHLGKSVDCKICNP